MADFPGASLGKQQTRKVLYTYALEAPRGGEALTLCGPDPSDEIKLLRDFIQWSAHRVWFIDHSLRVFRRAKATLDEEWPRANKSCQTLETVVTEWGSSKRISFANLDFMGTLSKSEINAYKEVVRICLPGAIIGVTWFCGRDGNANSVERIIGNTKVLLKESGFAVTPLRLLEYKNDNGKKFNTLILKKEHFRGTPAHGSVTAYTRTNGCRCAECRSAFSAYMRAYRRRKMNT